MLDGNRREKQWEQFPDEREKKGGKKSWTPKQEFRLKFRNVRPRMRIRANEWMGSRCIVRTQRHHRHPRCGTWFARRHNFVRCAPSYIYELRAFLLRFIAIRRSSYTTTRVRLRPARCDCHVLPIKDYLRLNWELWRGSPFREDVSSR